MPGHVVGNLNIPTVVVVDPVTGQPAAAASPLTDTQLRAAAVPTTDTRGSSAATITTDTAAVTGTFAAITVLSDAVFTSLTRANTTGTLGATTIPAGVTLFGTITGYQLASGAVIAYGA
jgi:hypothetical protein